MDKPMIGIRQADGSFYEILGDDQKGRKRLVLSAARTDQHGVRIDLYRSTDGAIDPLGALGSISLDDPSGLGYQDIEFHLNVNEDGLLDASAALPGQPPQTLSVDLNRFRGSVAPGLEGVARVDEGPSLMDEMETMTLDLPEVDESPAPRSDSDILEDESLDLSDLDTLDDFDLPDLDPKVNQEEGEVRRTDTDILEDESLDLSDLDTLDDGFAGEEDLAKTDDFGALDDLSFDSDPVKTEAADDFSLDEETPESRGLEEFSAPAFDLGDLDAGFGTPEPPTESADDWEKISLDDMEPMEFLDTGAEISAPKAPKEPPKAAAKAAAAPPGPSDFDGADSDPFRMDDDEPLDLGDLDSDLSDLPDLGDGLGADKVGAGAPEDDFDRDFLPPPELTPSSWEPEALSYEAPTSSKPEKAPKAAKAPKAPRTRVPATSSGDGGLDKLSLVLSLASLSLLVLLILVLLFLNMIKAPQPPVIQPEVRLWNGAPTAQESSAQNPRPLVLDLKASPPVDLAAQTILEIPQALRGAQISMTLEPGETAEEAGRRFGPPAQVQGDRLSW